MHTSMGALTMLCCLAYGHNLRKDDGDLSLPTVETAHQGALASIRPGGVEGDDPEDSSELAHSVDEHHMADLSDDESDTSLAETNPIPERTASQTVQHVMVMYARTANLPVRRLRDAALPEPGAGAGAGARDRHPGDVTSHALVS